MSIHESCEVTRARKSPRYTTTSSSSSHTNREEALRPSCSGVNLGRERREVLDGGRSKLTSAVCPGRGQ